MHLVPKRKLIPDMRDASANITIQHINQYVLDEMSDMPNIIHRLWVRHRLRIPVGADKFD